MTQTILYVGLDVDDTQYHGSAFHQPTGAGLDFQCRPTLKGLYMAYSSARGARRISGGRRRWNFFNAWRPTAPVPSHWLLWRACP